MPNNIGQSLNREPAAWPDAVLLAGILVLSLIGIGDYGLYEPHEAHFAGVGRDMATRGDWITPHLNGGRYLTKPPLFYWSIAASHKLFGMSEWAARFPLALIGWSGVVLCWHWARRLWGLRAGRMAAVILAVSAGWYLFTHQLLIDALLSVLYLASIYCFWRATLAPERRLYWALFYASLALGILAKGPIGAVFPVLAGAAFCVWRRNWNVLRHCRPLLGVLIILALVAPWLVPMELRNPGYIRYAIENENLKRVLDQRWPPDYSVSKVSAFRFVVISLVWMAPWCFLALHVIRFAWNNAQDSRLKTQDGVLLLSLAAAIPILFFVPMPSRLIYYSLPALPPFAILAAGWLSVAHEASESWARKTAALLMILAGLAILSALVWLPAKLEHLADLQQAPETLRFIPRLAVMMGFAMLLAGVLLAVKKPAWSVAALGVLLSLAGVFIVSGFGAFDNVRSSKRLVQALAAQAGEDCVWVSEGSKEIGASAGIAYYLGLDENGQSRSVYIMCDDASRPPPHFPDPQPEYLLDQSELAPLWNGPKPVLFITDFLRAPADWENDPPHFPPGNRYEVRVHEGTFLPGGHRRVFANEAAWERLKGKF